jgi:DNA modification methylase
VSAATEHPFSPLAEFVASDRAWMVHQGHVLDSLRGLPDGCIQTCVTSPPYWGLRAYGTNPQVWGGDVDCTHEWGEPVKPGNYNWADTINATAKIDHGHGQQKTAQAIRTAFCTLCGAWRGELGSEPTPDLFVSHLVEVFREVKRVLRDDGTLWMNLGDSYAGSGKGPSNGLTPEASQLGKRNPGQFANGQAPTAWISVPEGIKAKDLVGIPWMVAFALRADGWYLRQDIIWAKPNPMPESVTDRCTKAHEYLFLLSKKRTYYYDADAIRTPFSENTGQLQFETMDYKRRDRYKAPDGWATHNGSHGAFHQDGREKGQLAPEDYRPPSGANKRSVWDIATEAYPDAHFATFPTALVEPCIKAGTSERGCCPTCGAPWRRVVERTPMKVEHSARVDVLAADGYRTQTSGTMVPAPSSVTTGWQPSCTCDAGDPVPCLVLDCFSGSGTTVMTALRLNRRGLGLELSESYVALSERRIIGDAPLWNGLPS